MLAASLLAHKFVRLKTDEIEEIMSTGRRQEEEEEDKKEDKEEEENMKTPRQPGGNTAEEGDNGQEGNPEEVQAARCVPGEFSRS